MMDLFHASIRRPLLRYFGGKWALSNWIVEYFEPHQIYTESYGGGASALLKKPRSYAEVYNDLDGEIVNLFTVVRDRGPELLRALELTPYARTEFDLSYFPSGDPVEQARRTVVRSYMGYGSTMTRLTVTGRLMRTGFRNYSKKNRRSIPAHDWRTYPEAMPAIIDRLRGVIIEKLPAVEILRKHDGKETLHYVDPCYVHSTRGRSDGYRHEMQDSDHVELASVLSTLQGKVVLSGYRSPLYHRLFADWFLVTRPSMADGARPRTECLWCNFEPKSLSGRKRKRLAISSEP